MDQIEFSKSDTESPLPNASLQIPDNKRKKKTDEPDSTKMVSINTDDGKDENGQVSIR